MAKVPVEYWSTGPYKSEDGSEKGLNIKVKDTLFVDGKLKIGTLPTQAQDVQGAIEELFQGSSGGDDYGYKNDPYYQYYINLPEPADNQVIMKAYIGSDGYTFQMNNGGFDKSGTQSALNIDWGDGSTTDGTSDYGINHVYASKGNYTVTVNVTEIGSGLPGYAVFYTADASGMKFGKNTALSEAGTKLKFAKFLSDTLIFYNSDTYIDNTVRLYEFPNLAGNVQIPDDAFSRCYNLEKLNFDNSLLTFIGRSAFADTYNLKEAVYPNCTSVGDQAFYDSGLVKAEFSPDCVYGEYPFGGAYNLYPVPTAT
jgi:hypothetical protein